MARYNIAEYNIKFRVNWLFYFNNQQTNWAINFLLVGEYKGPFLTKTIYLSITLSAQVAQILNQKGNNGFFPKKEWNFNFLLLCNTVKPQLVYYAFLFRLLEHSRANSQSCFIVFFLSCHLKSKCLVSFLAWLHGSAVSNSDVLACADKSQTCQDKTS